MTHTSPRQAPSRRTRTPRRCLHLSYHLQHALAHLYYLPKVFVRCNTLYFPADLDYLFQASLGCVGASILLN